MIDKKEIRKMLVRTERARKSVLQPYFAEIGLPLGQGHVRILESLLAADHITQKELADRCHVDVTTMSRSLARLEEAGTRSWKSWRSWMSASAATLTQRRWNSCTAAWRKSAGIWRTDTP